MNELFRLTKIGIAVDQIDAAICLLIDESAYIPAVTLAGAAEEVLGRIVGLNSALNMLASDLATRHSLSHKQIADHLNHLRNWLKHLNSNENADTFLEFNRDDLEAASILMIERAAHNLVMFDGTYASEFPRFKKWLAQTRPDLEDRL